MLGCSIAVGDISRNNCIARCGGDRQGCNVCRRSRSRNSNDSASRTRWQLLLQVRGISAYPVEQRAERIKGRIEALARNPDFRAEELHRVDSDLGDKIMTGNQLVMVIFDADARHEGVNSHEPANANIERIRQIITDYRQARSPQALLLTTYQFFITDR